jgi:transcriptional regulator PpsR
MVDLTSHAVHLPSPTPGIRILTRIFQTSAHVRKDISHPVVDRLVRASSDLALLLDREGVLEEIYLGPHFHGPTLVEWNGRPWVETVSRDTRDKVDHLLAEARERGLSRGRQVNQQAPGGGEFPVSFTVVALEDDSGYLALGRDLQPLTDLQRQLVEAQQALERDYWRLRQVETRYQLLFQRSSEAVLLLDAETFRVVDANRSAGRIFGLPARKISGRVFPDDLDLDREVVEEIRAHLVGVRDLGRAETVRVRFPSGDRCRLEASLLREDRDGILLVHLRDSAESRDSASGRGVDLARLMEQAPDAFLVMDREARILMANRAFQELVQVGSEEELLGQSLGRWLGRPGADLTVLLANVEKFGEVRLFPTTIHSALDLESEVELSAVLGENLDTPSIGVIVRNVSRRIGVDRAALPANLSQAMEELTHQVGKVSLKELVQDTVGLVEAHFIEAALNLTDGNRTAAAELLGVSRQSLYTKLHRYDLDVPEAGRGGS